MLSEFLLKVSQLDVCLYEQVGADPSCHFSSGFSLPRSSFKTHDLFKVTSTAKWQEDFVHDQKVFFTHYSSRYQFLHPCIHNNWRNIKFFFFSWVKSLNVKSSHYNTIILLKANNSGWCATTRNVSSCVSIGRTIEKFGFLRINLLNTTMSI